MSQGPLLALVATTRYLLLVDLHSKTVTPLENHRPEYYGISWFPGDANLVLSHSALDNAGLLGLADYALSEVGFLSHGAASTPGFLSAPHQILCAPDGKLICCNTGRNAVAVLDLAQPEAVHEVRLSAPRWDRLCATGSSGDHLNSLFLQDGKLYVLAHGHGKGSELATLHYPDLRVMERQPVKGRTGMHNVWVTDEGQKIGCDSEAAALADLDDGSTLWQSGAFAFTRGLAASDDVVVVGESARLGRDLRSASPGGLWLIDRKTWKTLDYVFLGPYGAVHEVRLLNLPDHAHHGHSFAGLAALQQRDLGRDIAAQKKADAELAWLHRGDWAGFRFVIGNAQRAADGALVAQPGNLCLMCEDDQAGNQVSKHADQTHTGPASRSLDFEYALNREDSHVSVVSYHGKGDDSDMRALLVQASGPATAHLTLWTHDGQGWATEDGSVGSLPLAGRITVHADATALRFDVDGRTVLNCPAARMRLDGGRLGIRWLHAAIRRTRDVDV